MKRHFIELQIADLTELRDSEVSIGEEDSSYNRVLREIGVVKEREGASVPIDSFPLFTCLIDIDDIHAVSPLASKGATGYCQIEFKDEGRCYSKVDWNRLRTAIGELATIHVP